MPPLRFPSGKSNAPAPSGMPPKAGGIFGTPGASPSPSPKPMDDAQQGEPGDGSEQSGYAGPEFAPFQCKNCTHFDGQGACDHPEVINDPEVQGQVEPEGCCDYFKSKGGSDAQNAEADQGDEGAGAAAAMLPGQGDGGGYAG